MSYTWAGQTTGWTLGRSSGGGIAETFGYNDRLQLISQSATQNGSTRLSLTYGYQASAGQMGAGSTARNAGQLMSVSGTIGGGTESAAFTYEMWNATSGGTQMQSVTLDQPGGVPTNRITSVTNSGSTVNTPMTPRAMLQTMDCPHTPMTLRTES